MEWTHEAVLERQAAKIARNGFTVQYVTVPEACPAAQTRPASPLTSMVR
jgi:hypothetical protein